MNVLLWIPRSSDVPGGHVVQARSTAAGLRGLGLHVTESTAAEPDIASYDMVHGFGLAAAEVEACREAHVPVALSTIYGPRNYRYAYAGGSRGASELVRKVRRAGGAARRALLPRPIEVERLAADLSWEFSLVASFSAADVLLPNAEGERSSIAAELGVATRSVVIPNAVDPELFPPAEGLYESRPVDVLMVGRLEPHKNQLGLIEAMRDSGYSLTIAGPEHPHHHDYAARCRSAGAGWAEFVDGCPQEELAQLYHRAKVHVLPTWFETTGLVSLEAALCGCSVVSTSRGYANEYLGQDAHYCDPTREKSIRVAVDAAMAAGPSDVLRKRVLNRFTWRQTAEATLSAYRLIIG